MSALLVTILEYITGALLEKIFRHKWRYYSRMLLNIKGYVCIPFSIIWDVVCVVIVKLLHPIVYKIFSWIPKGEEIKYFRYVKVYLLAYDIDKQQALLWEVCSYF